MPDVTLTVPVAVNRCAGGFRLSPAAAHELARRKGIPLREEDGFLLAGDGYGRIEELVRRDDPDLVAIVRRMGPAAGASGTDIRVVEVMVEIEVTDSHGLEDVHVHGRIA